MNGKRGRFGDIPIKEGETYDVEIEGIGEKGDGIARISNYVIIVPNVQKGDKVKVKVNAVRGKVSFGEVVGEASESDIPAKEEEASQEETEEASEPEEETGDTETAKDTQEPEEEGTDSEEEDSTEAEEEKKEE